MPEMAQIFTEESCMPSRRLLINFQLSRPYWVHVWAILGSCFGYFYNIFASRCLKLFKFSLKNHACYIEEYSLMFNFWDHIWAMFGPYQANVLAISIVSLLLRTLIMLVNGYFGIVWWYFATWGATWDPWSCFKQSNFMLKSIIKIWKASRHLGLILWRKKHIAQPRTYPQLPLSFANGQLFGGAL